MKLRKWIAAALCAAMAVTAVPFVPAVEVQAATVSDREVLDMNTNWLYSNVDYLNGEIMNLDESTFEEVSVPHANTLLKEHTAEDFEKDIASYRFVSWYRRHFTLGEEYADRNIRIEFEGVATIAEVYINGTYISTHEGAYTTFTVDISDYVYTDGRDNVLAVRVDSEKQVQVPPEGGVVDYCLFGGIVRDVSMIVTEPVYVERTFVTTPDLETLVKEDKATVNTQVDISNKLDGDKTYTVETTLNDADGKEVASASAQATLTAGAETTVEVEMDNVSNPHLWDVDDPYLYTVVTEIKDGDTVIDSYDTRIGMRYFEFGDGTNGDGNFYLNGEKLEIVGINRHEQWPYIGRAVPDKLQVQDADLIKANGINLVRCSHYPQDPSFMDRCDEIGLLVFTEAPGWQHIGDDNWKETFKNNLTELILRDRNHPSVISWSATPNESGVNIEFNTECHNLVKSLDPTRPTHGVRVEFDYPYGNGNAADTVGTDILTVNYTYQNDADHTPPHMPYIITEHSNDCWFNGYGRPGASDAGAQGFVDSFARVVDAYYANDAVAGGIGWSMFDYNNEVNYTNTQHVFYSGLYDLWRHEKPVAYMYRTQQDVEDAGAIVYISNNWTADTSSTVYVMSNCDEIELFVNGTSKGRITPNKFTNLPHPIFEFTGITYEAGELKAVGYVNGEVAGECVRTTPGEAVALTAVADYSTLTADGTDMTSVSVTAVDANGNEVPFATNTINVVQTSGVETTLIQEENVALEGGQIAFLVQSVHGEAGTATFEVMSEGLTSGTCTIEIEEFTADNLVPASTATGTEEPLLPKKYNVNDTFSGTGLYQLDYQGTGWQYGTETTAYKGDNYWSDVAGDSVEIDFIGPNIQFYGAKAPAHGIVAFSIDGGEEVLVDCYAAERQGSVVLFDSGLLEDTEHTLTVRITGDKNAAATGTYLSVDRVLYDFAYVTPTAVVNNTDVGTGMNQLQYSAGWTQGTASAAYLGDDAWTNAAGETMTFTFTGTGLKYYAAKASHQGIGAFSIDGGEEQMVDFYQAAREDQALVYEVSGLENGEHTLTVRVTGDKNSASTDAYVVVDKIEVYDAVEEPLPEVLADFHFDDEATGFTSDYGKATGSYTLQDNGDGKALYLNGTSNYLEVLAKDKSSLLTGVKEMTISFQAKPEAGGVGWLFYAAPNENAQTYAQEVYLGLLDQGGTVLAERYYNTDGRPASASAAVSADDWYHLTAVHTETETILYVNGVEAARQSSSYALSSILGDESILYIGKANWGSGEYYKGLIDNYKIYSRALTAEEVLAEYEGKEETTPVRDIFEDVNEGDWFEAAVQYVYDNNIMTGMTETTFEPFESLSRAQLALILYRLNGSPAVEYSAVFSDVPEGQWYTNAVLWAQANGIVTGYGNSGVFGPHDMVQREQMAVMMYRYANYKQYDTSTSADLSVFEDAASISGYAEDAAKWAVGYGIITGKSNGTAFDPQGNTLRSEGATIIMRFMETYK